MAVMTAERGVSTKRVGLDLDRSKKHPNTQIYEAGLRGAIKSYELLGKVFTQGQGRVIAGTVRVLAAYGMDIPFCDDPERNLFALAIGDQFFRRARNADRLRNALNMVKVIAVNETCNKTLSGHVRLLSERGRPQGMLFNPGNPYSNSDQDYYEKIAQYIDTYENSALSRSLASLLNNRSSSSLLHECRTDLNITLGNEDPYQVSVLNKTTEEIGNDLGFMAYTSDHRDITTIAVGRDWSERLGVVIHEYLHTQESPYFTRGLKRLMFDGAREAFISLYEKGDGSYYWMTEGLLTLFKFSPDLKQPFALAFRGDENARRLLLSEVTRRFGFEGLLTLAFMWDTKHDSDSHDKITNRIRRTAHIDAGYAYPIFESPGYIWRW